MLALAGRALLLVTLVLASAWVPARAQALLTPEVESVDLWPHVRVLSDPGRSLTVEQLLARREAFATPKGAYATLGWANEALWLHVPLAVRPGGDGTWVLDFDYALLQRLDVYLVRDGTVARQARLGNDQPYAQRPMRGRSHAVMLDVPAGQATELLVRVDTSGARILPVSLSRPSAFHAGALNEQLLQGALVSLGVILLLYSLAQWFTLREELYLKYALLVLCSVTFSLNFFGIGEMYLWRDSAWIGRHMAGITALMAAGATALFVQDALAGDLHPGLGVALRVVFAIHALATVAFALDWIDIRTVGYLMNTVGLAPSLLGVPGAWAKARRGDSVGAWFLAAWLGYFVASAIMVGVVRGNIGAGFWTMHSFQLGATFDMLVFMRIAVLRSAARMRATQRAAQERDRMHSLAHSDPLTGLLNRRGLHDALDSALPRATNERVLAVYLLDLDGFKPVNDQFGHDVGDELLLVVAQRLRGSVRSGDGVARIGGDEFVVMAVGLTHEGQAEELGVKLLEAFATPFALRNNICRVGATIGYALAPRDASDAAALIKAADSAMYAGKQKGKGRLDRVTAA